MCVSLKNGIRTMGDRCDKKDVIPKIQAYISTSHIHVHYVTINMAPNGDWRLYYYELILLP